MHPTSASLLAVVMHPMSNVLFILSRGRPRNIASPGDTPVTWNISERHRQEQQHVGMLRE